MIVDELLKGPGSWLSMRKDTGIAISSRVRLARNVEQAAYPGWAGEEERVRLYATLKRVVGALSSVAAPLFLDMGELSTMDKDILCERHLISHELCARGRGSGVAIADGEQIAIMINEEDHLRLQVMAPGMRLREIWRRIDVVDSEIEQHVSYAFSDSMGYLTACPSNVGTGLRASVMLHLAGLKMLNEVDAVVNGLEKLGLSVRGLLGEGTEAHGNMYQVSNQQTLGESEEEIVDDLVTLIEEVILHEQNARMRLMERGERHVIDAVARARGILLNCRILSSNEAVSLLSDLRLGVELDLIGNLKIGLLNEILLLTQPGHLQKMAGKLLGPEERDELRAGLVRDKLRDICLLV